MKKWVTVIGAALLLLLIFAAVNVYNTTARPVDNQGEPVVAGDVQQPEEAVVGGNNAAAQPDQGADSEETNQSVAKDATMPEDNSDVNQDEKAIISMPKRVAVKGIYATGYTAGSKNINRLIDLINETELNALVVDVKDATGYLTTPLAVDNELSVSAHTYKIKDMKALVTRLKENNIYTIARVVIFKDTLLAEKYPNLAVAKKSGGIWRDYSGKAWTNPYDRKVWDYNVAVAKAAARAGFEEIQLDYVRFPSDGPLKETVYPGADDKTKAETIAAFVSYARQQLRQEGAYISADVFGLTCSADDDLGIGQKLELIAAGSDYVSPMVYPSHYAPGSYGIKNPNASPYRTVYKSLTDAVYKTQGIDSIIRPWLQDFTYGYPYAAKEVRAQIKATYDAGLEEWILWNASNRYTAGALERN